MSKKETKRNKKIVELRQKGLTFDAIGRVFPKPDGTPLSRQRIDQICKEAENGN